MNIRIPDFSNVRVLVAGDVMFDRYWYGATARISPEAPVPVVRVGGEEGRPGGAGNVAANIASVGAQATVIGATGRDDAADRLARALDACGVACDFLRVDGMETITKLRVISRHQQLIRLDFEPDGQVIDAAAFNRKVVDALGVHDVLVISDYAKGTLGDTQALIAAARKAGKPVLVDPKGQGYRRYRGATLLTPNLGEFEAVAGACPDEATLVEKGRRLREDLALDALLVTRSEHGMTLITSDDVLHLPAQALEVFDVTGAGDTAIALLAAGLAAGLPLPDAAALGNFAAGLVVAKLGAASVTPAELKLAMKHRTGGAAGVLEEDELLEAVRFARGHGERVVMTNGCFDILLGTRRLPAGRARAGRPPCCRRQQRRFRAQAERRCAPHRAAGAAHGGACRTRRGRLGRAVRHRYAARTDRARRARHSRQGRRLQAGRNRRLR